MIIFFRIHFGSFLAIGTVRYVCISIFNWWIVIFDLLSCILAPNAYMEHPFSDIGNLALLEALGMNCGELCFEERYLHNLYDIFLNSSSVCFNKFSAQISWPCVLRLNFIGQYSNVFPHYSLTFEIRLMVRIKLDIDSLT